MINFAKMKQKLKKNNLSNSAFWIGGKHVVETALKNSKRKIYKFILHKKLEGVKFDQNFKIKPEYANDSFFRKIFNDEIPHQGYALLVEKLQEINLKYYLEQNTIFNIIALDGITDPRNIGSIIRTAVAFGCDAILINRKDFNSKSFLLYKAASGAMENIIILEVSNIHNEIKLLKKNNFWVVGMDGSATQSLYDYKVELKNVFIFGSENAGMKKLMIENCDTICKIPISPKIESLNVSNAVASTLSVLNFNNQK